MNIADRAAVHTFTTSLTAVGVKAPKPVADAHARTIRLVAATGNLSAGDGALAVAVTAALDAGRDPAADPDVVRVLIGHHLANEGVMQAVAGAAYDQLREVCRAHADAIVAAWRKPFDRAAATLVAAHERLAVSNLNDTSAVVALGGDAAAAWTQAQAASEVITTVSTGWQALGLFTRAADTASPHAMLRLTKVDHATYLQHELHGARLSPWDLVVRNVPLRLPTFTEYGADVAGIVRAQEAASALGVVDHARSAVAGREIRVPA